MQIIRKDTDARHGRYIATVAGISEQAMITFTRQGPGVISADHTSVPASMSGMGVGKALVEFMVADAESEGFMIVPVCPFVQSQYTRHPEWSRNFTSEPGEVPSL